MPNADNLHYITLAIEIVAALGLAAWLAHLSWQSRRDRQNRKAMRDSARRAERTERDHEQLRQRLSHDTARAREIATTEMDWHHGC